MCKQTLQKKKMFGQSIMQYGQHIRLSMERERILFSKMSLEQIAETCGFNSYTHFYRVCRAKYGVSPREFRLAGNEEAE